MARIIDTTDPSYIAYKKLFMPKGKGSHNGVYYYSQEIVKNIIPNVQTDRPWDTLGIKMIRSSDHAIVFLHHNLNHDVVYAWLKKYQDLIYVCSVNQTYEWAKRQKNGHAVFLPLSIDVDYVKQFASTKTKNACYAGNKWKFKLPDLEKYLPKDVEFPPANIPREDLLRFIAPYRICYAVGRTALEAICLGCQIKICDSRYPDPNFWKLLDNKDAAKILQQELDRLDGKPRTPISLAP